MCFISLYECGAVCAFTAVDYSAGYCAPLCDAADGCPDGWACNPIPGQAEAKVCLLEPAVADGGGDDVGGAGDAAPVDEGGPGGEVATAEVGGDVPVADDPGSSDPGTPAADAGRDDAGGGSAGGGCRAGAAPVVAWPWMLLAGWAVSRGRRKTPPD
jgi:hypothetical protein